jgi:hypothetical protein
VQQVPSVQYSGLPEPYRSQALAGRAERTLVLRPAGKLQPDTQYTLTIPAAPVRRGPERSKALAAKFRTYPPLTSGARTASDRYSWDCSPDRTSPSGPAPRSSTTPSCPSACV